MQPYATDDDRARWAQRFTAAKVTTYRNLDTGEWRVAAEVSGWGGEVLFGLSPGEARKVAADMLAMAQDAEERQEKA